MAVLLQSMINTMSLGKNDMQINSGVLVAVLLQSMMNSVLLWETRLDTRLPQSRAGGQEQYLRSAKHLGRSSKAKNLKNAKKVKCDGRTDGRTDRRTNRRTDQRMDGPTGRGVELRARD